MNTYDLNLLRTLDAVLSTGSVTAAAERLHLSVPATSHALTRLREAFGDPLLVRAGRRLVPTPRALALKEPVATWLAQAAAWSEPPSQRRLEDVQRRFVLRAPDGLAVAVGAPLATALKSAMPLATLAIVPETYGDASALREGRVDLDVGSFRPREPEVETQVLGDQPLVGVVQAQHPLARGPRTAVRYAAQDHVAVLERQNLSSPVDAALEALGLRRHVRLTVPLAYAALVAAARGGLVATVSQRMARILAPSLSLTVFQLPFDVPREPMLMAWHPRHSADPAHAWLRAQVQRALSDVARKMAPGRAAPRA